MKKLPRIILSTLTGLGISSAVYSQNVTVYYPNWANYEADYQPEDIPVQDIDEIVYAFAQVGNCAAPYATDTNPTLCNKAAYATGVQGKPTSLAASYSI
jgi:GH18 family chitinase